MNNTKNIISQIFTDHFGDNPTHFIQAPGRVNLIGEHTDYNDGFVLPCAINLKLLVASRKRTDKTVRVIASDYRGASDEFTLSDDIPQSSQLWANYIRGVVQFLYQRGYEFSGADLVIGSKLPLSVGLGSSAALEVAIAQTFNLLYHLDMSDNDIAITGQMAENEYVGFQCGIMDQLISIKGEENNALLIDCRDLHTQAIPIPKTHAVMIINSNEQRDLVESKFNIRSLQCSTIASQLRVPALRDANLNLLQRLNVSTSSASYKRAKHVITENSRTIAMAKALLHNDMAEISRLMRESHISMRDDFSITIPEIDFLVETIDKALGDTGGVRMTGGGFGGCVVALVPHEKVDDIIQLVANTYEAKTGTKETIYLCYPSDGAGPIF
ncbi:MAG: galactokinase [Gammaproteobacteria bacterium]|nr:galactokinase [Gammaproteobacteria bacterium]